MVVTLKGSTFRVHPDPGVMPLMTFAHHAARGTDSFDMAGLAAIYDLLKSCIVDADWARFAQKAVDSRADADELLDVVKQVMGGATERPTVRPSDSSVGPQAESVPSAEGSSSAVVRRLETEGRPSIALMVRQAQASTG